MKNEYTYVTVRYITATGAKLMVVDKVHEGGKSRVELGSEKIKK